MFCAGIDGHLGSPMRISKFVSILAVSVRRGQADGMLPGGVAAAGDNAVIDAEPARQPCGLNLYR